MNAGTPPDNLVGTRIAGYQIEGLLGEGGMGKVYRARQLSLNRPVALKFLSVGMVVRPDVIARFAREARAAAAVSSPHLIQVHDFVEEGGTPFYVMELVEGLSLGEYLKRGESFPEAECIEIGRQVLKALQVAHAAGIVHRDIKPGNLMLDPRGQIKVGDLGLARVADAGDETTLTVTGAMMGTPLYMSPEQGRGQASVDHRSDFYSLGATLYHLATRRPPYGGGNPLEIIQRHIADPVPWARDANPAVSGTFSDLIRSLMAKDPKDRPQTHAAILEGLDGCASLLDSDDLATGPTVLGRARVRSKEASRPFYARPGVLAGAMVALLLVAGSFGLVRWRQDRQREIQGQRESAAVAERMREQAEQRRAEAEAAKLRAEEQERERQAALAAERQRMEQERLAKARGGLLVRVEPAGAMVSVDGGGPRPGPVAAFSDLGLGKHRVRVSADGYGPMELETEVAEGKVTEAGPVALQAIEKPGPAIPVPGPMARQGAGASTTPAGASVEAPFVNSLGMRFVPVPGTGVLFSIWETRVKDFEAFVKESGYGWYQRPPFGQTADDPVVMVSWDDAKAFCEWLSTKEGFVYRLPTDDEWDAAVGKDRYPWGDEWPPPSGAENVLGEESAGSSRGVLNGYRDLHRYTSPVGSYRANWAGLYDMGGDAREWVADHYSEALYKKSKKGGGHELSSSARVASLLDKNRAGSLRVSRGGNWCDCRTSDFTVSSVRFFHEPDTRAVSLGFRCVLELPGR